MCPLKCWDASANIDCMAKGKVKSNPGQGCGTVGPYPGGAPWEGTWRGQKLLPNSVKSNWGHRGEESLFCHLHHLENPPKRHRQLLGEFQHLYIPPSGSLGISFVICKMGRRPIPVQMTSRRHREDFMNSSCHDSFYKHAGSARMRFHGVGKVPTHSFTCYAHGGASAAGTGAPPPRLRDHRGCPVSTSWLESERNN